MNHVLKYDPLGIDEHDVKSCVDVKLLQHWKSEIDQDTRLIQHQIDVESLSKTTKNSLWFIKAKTAKQKFGQLSQIIQQRIGELNRLAKQIKTEKFERAFYDIAYERLPSDLFFEIKNEAHTRLTSNS